MRQILLLLIIVLTSLGAAMPTLAQTNEEVGKNDDEVYYKGRIASLHDLAERGDRHFLNLLDDPPRNRAGTWFAPDWIETVESATIVSGLVYEAAADVIPPEQFQDVHDLTLNAFRLNHESQVSFVRALRTQNESDFALAKYQAADALEQLEQARAYWDEDSTSTFDEIVAEAGPDCSWFLYQEESQEAFAVMGDLFPDLDEDGNGVACDELPSRTERATPGETIPEDVEAAEMIRVIDETTIEVRLLDTVNSPDGGDVAQVRLIGIKAPYIGEDEEPSGCPRWTPRERIARMLMSQSDKPLWLESDQRDRVPGGILLRYVWFEGDQDPGPYLINELLIRDGFATFEGMYPLSVHGDRLRAAERAAKDDEIGLWSC